MDSERLCQHAQDLHKFIRQDPSIEGKWTPSLTLTEKLFAVDMSWKGKTSCLLLSDTGYIKHTPRAGPMPWSRHPMGSMGLCASHFLSVLVVLIV